MPRKTFISREARTPGKGNRMDPATLKKIVLVAFRTGLRPSELEKELQLSHGVSVRLCKKIKAMELTFSGVSNMTPKQLHGLMYTQHRTRKVQDQSGNDVKFIQPDLPVIYQQLRNAEQSGGTRSDQKTRMNRSLIFDQFYYKDEENKKRASAQGLKFLSVPRLYAMLHDYEAAMVEPVFRKNHRFGQEAQYDFTGVKQPYGDREHPSQAEFMLGVLPASGFLFAEAIASQKTEDVMPCFANSFKFWGGCPEVVRVDNFKAAISQAGNYGGIVTANMNALLRFFDVEIFSCRSRCPTDKGCIEAHVKYFTHKVLALVRNHVTEGGWFNNLEELNAFIRPLVEEINNHAIRGMNKTRKENFEIERQYLHQPACWDYKLVDARYITVPPTASYLFNGHEYAVQPEWIGKELSVEIGASTVGFYSNSILVAGYLRKDGVVGKSAMPGCFSESMEIIEIYKLETQLPMLEQWAASIGPATEIWTKRALKSRVSFVDKIRRIVKVLKLPKGFIARCSQLDECINELQLKHGRHGVSAGQIIDAYKKLKLSQDNHRDPVHNIENYLEAGRAVIYGQSTVMRWDESAADVAQDRIQEQEQRSEYLNGRDHYKKQYDAVDQALSGGKDGAEDDAGDKSDK